MRVQNSIPLLLISLLLTTGCAHQVQRHDWSNYEGPGAEVFAAEEVTMPSIADPIEPMNRTFWALNDVLMRGVVDPLARGYVFITPKWFRAGVQNFGANLVYPRRAVNNLLQGKWGGARDETYRFAINTTLGIVGILDLAKRWGIEASDEDFGQTFAKWGWEKSTYNVLPFMGPSTIRDTIGLVPDSALSLATYAPVPFLSQLFAFNNGAEMTGAYKLFMNTHEDGYQLARVGWSIAREKRATDFVFTPEDTGKTQTLRALFLDVKDKNYRKELFSGKVFLPETGKKFPYSYRMQEGPAPVLFVIPGTGGHRLEGSPLALSEMAWDRGFSVVILSSTLNFEFMENGASVALPGHTPVDAHDTHVAIDAIYQDLNKEYPDRMKARALMGYSLGAFHTFYIAAAEADPENELIDFDRYVTLDSPVDLVRGLEQLDNFYNAPLVFPEEERDAEIRTILHKAIYLAERGFVPEEAAEEATSSSPSAVKEVEEDIARTGTFEVARADMQPAGLLPFSNLEAEFLIGFAFRITLGTAIYTSQEREDIGVLETPRGWLRRVSAYEEVSEYSFGEYIYGFLMPYYRETLGVEGTVEDLLFQNDLRSIEAGLRENSKIRHFSNRNDFLTTDEDISWLTGVLGEPNVKFYAEGGHLGNMYRPVVQNEVMSAMTDLLD